MPRHTATFDIESRSDARTAARAIDELYNRLREENRTVRDGDATAEPLKEFERLRSEIDADAAGELVVSYRPASRN